MPISEQLRALEKIAGRSLCTVSDLSGEEVDAVFHAARLIASGTVPLADELRGRVVLTAFFEPSTRTRLSFESAAARLGAGVISIADVSSTAIGKGESISDFGRMLDSYADVIVVRHAQAGVIDEIRAHGLGKPLMNAGNGWGEHPTQALCDWLVLEDWMRREDAARPAAMRLGIIGIPRRMRSIRSFLLLGCARFRDLIRDMTFVSSEPDCLDRELAAALAEAGIPIAFERDLDRVVGEFDAVYINSLALRDGHYVAENAEYRLDGGTPLKREAVILHPLARGAELSSDLDNTRHNLYFKQAEWAVPVRQALLLAVCGQIDALAEAYSASSRR
jgi:aspartate carbamoyltransferase catalytic subunit